MLKTAKSYLLYKKHLTQKSADDKIRSLAASQPRPKMYVSIHFWASSVFAPQKTRKN